MVGGRSSSQLVERNCCQVQRHKGEGVESCCALRFCPLTASLAGADNLPPGLEMDLRCGIFL